MEQKKAHVLDKKIVLDQKLVNSILALGYRGAAEKLPDANKTSLFKLVTENRQLFDGLAKLSPVALATQKLGFSSPDRANLSALIKQFQKSDQDAVYGLYCIREKELFKKVGFKKFVDYCEEVLGIGGDAANRRVSLASVRLDIESVGIERKYPIVQFLVKESHARSLVCLGRVERYLTLLAALESLGDRELEADDIRAARDRLYPQFASKQKTAQKVRPDGTGFVAKAPLDLEKVKQARDLIATNPAQARALLDQYIASCETKNFPTSPGGIEKPVPADNTQALATTSPEPVIPDKATTEKKPIPAGKEDGASDGAAQSEGSHDSKSPGSKHAVGDVVKIAQLTRFYGYAVAEVLKDFIEETTGNLVKISKPLPTVAEFLLLQRAFFTRDLGQWWEMACDQVEQVKVELESWLEKLPPNLQGSPQSDLLEEAISALDEIEVPELPDSLKCYRLHHPLARGGSRTERLHKVGSIFRDCAAELQRVAASSDTAAPVAQEASQVAAELGEIIPQLESITPPGMC